MLPDKDLTEIAENIWNEIAGLKSVDAMAALGYVSSAIMRNEDEGTLELWIRTLRESCGCKDWEQ